MITRRNLIAAATALFAGASVQASQSPWPATLTDVLGRRVRVYKAPSRIVVADYVANFIITAGEPSLARVAAIAADHWETARTGEYRVFTKAFPQLLTLPSIGGYHDNLLNTERILSLKPDVLLTSVAKFKDNAQRMAILERAGIAVIVLDYHAMTQENHATSTRLIGRIIGTEARAEELVGEMTQGVALIRERIAALPVSERRRPVYLELGSKGVGDIGNSYNKTVLWGAMLETIEAGNIARDNRQPWGALTREFVIEHNPEVIIVGGSLWSDANTDQMKMGLTVSEDEAMQCLRRFASRPEWQMTDAVKTGRIYAVDHGSLRNILDWHMTAFLAKACYPQAFSDIDPERDLHEAYRRYVPQADADGVFTLTLKQ